MAVVQASAGFREESWDPRSLALGNASTALVDSTGLFPYWNPAAFGAVKNGEFGASYGQPAHKRGQPDRALGSVLFSPLQKDSPVKFGVWATRSDTLDVLREDTYALTVARQLSGIKGYGLFLGGNLKYLSQIDRVTPTNDDSVVSGDLGLLYAFQNGLSFGLSVRDLNAPSIGDSVDKKVPAKASLGSSWAFAHTLLSVDVVSTFDDNGEDTIHSSAGLEQRLLSDKLAFRIGANSKSINTGVGVRVPMGSNALLDLAYTYVDPYADSTESPLHMGSLKLRFGPEASTMRARPVESSEEPKVVEAVDTDPMKKEFTAEARNRSDFVLGPDDVIQIEVKNHPELDVTTVVNPWGYIEVPFVGTLSVKGQTEKEIEESLGKIYTDFFTQAPVVDVTVKEYNSRVIYVLGAVLNPGKYHLKGNPLTLRDAVVMAGLPTERASTWRVFVVRQGKNGPIFKHINLTKVLYRGRLDNNIEIESGDIIYLPMTILDTIATFIGRILSPIFGLPSVFAVHSGA